MKQIFNIVLLIFIIFIDVSLSARKSGKHQVKNQNDALTWLNKYGYNPCLTSGVQCSISLASLIKDYQTRFSLRITGKLDDQTKQHMNQPRCGNKDKSIAELNAAKLQEFKWSRSSLTYSIRSYPTQLSETSTERIIHEAFDAWLEYIPIKIEKTCATCKSDFVIEFSRDDHADKYPFDGIGGTLAHAFFPEDGRIHFDKDEAWTERFDGSGTNLYLVAVHEIGHSLGIDHTYNAKSIMYPSYQLMQKSSILPQPDREIIQKLYGGKQPSYVTPTTTRSTTRSTTTTRRSIITTRNYDTDSTGKSHPRCRLIIDAAFKHPDGTLHTLDTGILWRYLPNEQKWEDRTTSFGQAYSRLPNQLAAGLYNSDTKKILIFTNTDVYIYEINSQNRAEYVNVEPLPNNLRNSIVGAIYYRNEMYVITATTIRSFKLGSFFRVSGDRSISKEFPGFTGTVIKAFSYGDLHHFFTTDGLVYVWSERLNTWQTSGKPRESGWFACSNTGMYTSEDIQARRPNRHRNSHRQRPSYHHHHHHHD